MAEHDDCPMHVFCKIVGSKWGCIIVKNLEANGEMGFNELGRMLRTNPKTLSVKLKHLERSGLLKRNVASEKRPIRVFYSLTAKGREAGEVDRYISTWMKTWDGR